MIVSEDYKKNQKTYAYYLVIGKKEEWVKNCYEKKEFLDRVEGGLNPVIRG